MGDNLVLDEPPLSDDPPRRRASDYAPPFSFSRWVRTNLGLAAAIMGGIGTIVGGIITVTLWYASVSGTAGRVSTIEPKVEALRLELNVAEADIKRLQESIVNADKRMNDIRAAMDQEEKTIADARRSLDQTDAAASEARARLDERLKGLEGHSVPLPLLPRGR